MQWNITKTKKIDIPKITINKSKHFWTKEQLIKAIELHNSGISNKDIADRIGRTNSSVRTMLSRIRTIQKLQLK